MEISVAEAARLAGVSPRRVRALIQEGRIPARRVARQWLVDPAGLRHSQGRLPRPMSPRMAWAFLHGPDSDMAATLAPSERWRLSQSRRNLAAHDSPERLLAAWMRARADRAVRRAPDLEHLTHDSRVVPAGLSDKRARLSGPEVWEGYVARRDFDEVELDALLSFTGVADANAVIHIVDNPSHLPHRPVPALLIAADLAEWGGWREAQRAREIIRDEVRGEDDR